MIAPGQASTALSLDGSGAITNLKIKVPLPEYNEPERELLRQLGVAGELQAGDKRAPGSIPESERDYYLERRYPSFGNLVPRDIASRAAKAECDAGRGVGESGLGVYLDLADSIHRLGKHKIAERYGNLIEIRHRDGIVTRYGHLSSIGIGIHPINAELL